MKYFVIFLLCCVAFAAAAPQVPWYPGLTYGGVITPGLTGLGRTVVAGPTVVNGLGGRVVSGGYII